LTIGVEQDVGTHRCLTGQLSQTQPDFGGNWTRIGRRAAAAMADWLVNGAGPVEGSSRFGDLVAPRSGSRRRT
jgi:hypothetical protein